MTSATSFAPLLAPVLDDSMEVSSSPAGKYYDDEVLIDYDDYGTATFAEDERMIEDGEQARPGTAADDMMEDAEFHPTVNEEIMHDDPVTSAPDSYIEDEELIDYSDDEYQDDTQVTLEDSTLQITEVAGASSVIPAENLVESGNVDVAIVQQSEDALAVEEPTTQFLTAAAEENAGGASTDEATVAVTALDDDHTAHVDQDDTEELSHQAHAEEAAAHELGAQAFEADATDVHATEASDDQQEHDEIKVLNISPKIPAGLDTTASFAADGPQTPSDTGIHPITVRYGDSVMPLFKSRIQHDGLLKDDNLASVSLGDLLDNCRHRLALKIGESISADQELVLSFENMGLQLVEHSPHAFETSLDDVLAIYMNLHRNDSAHPIPPLVLSLSLQLKFTSSLNILKAAAQQGEGMSKFAYLRSGAEELDEYEEEEEGGQDEEHAGHEEYREDEAAGGELHYEGEDALTENHTDEQVLHLEEGQEYEEDQYPENQEGDEEDHTGQSYNTRQYDSNYEEYDQQHLADANAELEPHRDNDDHPQEGADMHGDYVNEDEPDHEAEELDAFTAHESEEHVRPESAASSTTVRGDLTNDPIGEYYNEDFIDFGDDDLTAETAELHVNDGNGNSPILVSERNGEEAAADDIDATAADDDLQPDVTSAAFAFAPNEENIVDQQSDDEVDGALADDDTEAYETRDNNDDQHEQGEDLPADNLGLNEEDPPAEADDQFDTAFDLLEDHDFENVPENGDLSVDGLEYSDDDDIGFNDDVEEAIIASNSPSAKRSFEEHVGENGVAEEQESKKVRS